jgi:hypothetical protein
MGKSDKASHRKLVVPLPGRPPAKPGKQVSTGKKRTAAATEAARVEGARGIFMSMAARFAVCLKFASGEIIDFSSRRLLLLMMMNTITTMAAGALTFGVDTVKWGIRGMTKVYEIVASATSVSMSALRTIFEGSSESDGRVFIETPDKSNRGRGSNSCSREKLRKLTPWRYKAIMNYIDWSNETRGQVCAAACAGGGWGRGEGGGGCSSCVNRGPCCVCSER